MKGYRTVVLNIVMGLGLVLASPDVMALIQPHHVKYVVAFQAVLNIVMRVITTTAFGQKDEA